MPFLLCSESSHAQSEVVWSNPVNLSRSAADSRHPAIVADDFGNVHVMWSEARNADLTDAAIMYTRWNGNRWTVPTEVLVSPNDGLANSVAIDIGPDGRLHAIWGGQANFYYSSANDWEAESANAWTMPITVATNNARSVRESNIAVDDGNFIHILYATRGEFAGIYHMSSSDGGATWGEATRISNRLSQAEAAFANVRLVDDSSGRLHATWETVQDEGFGQAVYYARSLDGGTTWESPVQFESRDGEDTYVSLPYVTPRGSDELHLIYVDGNTKRRAYRTSSDGGATWSEPEAILTRMEGVNGYVFPLVDGNDRLHLIVNMRTQAGQQVGIYHAYEVVQGGWSPLTPVDNSSPAAPVAHQAAAAVLLGNEIHVVYTQAVENEIWYVRGVIQDVEQETALPIPAVALSSSEPEEQPTEMAPTAEELQQPSFELDMTAAPPPQSSSSVPIMLGAAAALLLVLLIVVVRARRL